MAPLARLTVGVLRRFALPPTAVELTEAVHRRTSGAAIGGNGEALARRLGLSQCLLPFAMKLLDRGPVHQTLPGERHHPVLAVAPGGQRSRPLVGTAELGDLLTGFDHRAVHRSSHRRRHLPGHDRHHGLVECRQALAHPTLREPAPALDVERQRHHIAVAEPAAHLCRPSGRRPAAGVVTDQSRLLERTGKQHVPERHGLLTEVVHHPADPGEPTLGLPEVAAVDQVVTEPEGTPHPLLHLARVDVQLISPLQRTDAVADVAHQVRGDGQQLQIAGPHPDRGIRLRQRRVGVRPLPSPRGSTAPYQRRLTDPRSRLVHTYPAQIYDRAATGP